MVVWGRNDCPTCETNEHVRYRRTVGNVLRVILNAILFPLWSLVSGWGGAVIAWYPSMAFVCLQCRTRFRGEKRQGTPMDQCARCRYSLLGNQTGRCPECGWRIPRAFRRILAGLPKQDDESDAARIDR